MKVLCLIFFNLLLFISCGKYKKIAPYGEFRIESTLEVGSLERTFTVVLLSTYYSDQNSFPVLIAMHGGGGSAKKMEDSYGLKEKSEEEKYIIIYPDGVQSEGILKVRTWNVGFCCEYAMEKNIDDVGFLSQMIDEVNRIYKSNSKRVYATGMSNGGMMAYRLGCEISNKIAAIAPVACTMVTISECKPKFSMPIIQFHSILDKNVPFNGGIGIRGINYPAVEKGIASWAAINDCKNIAKVLKDDQNFKLTEWTSCNSQTEIHYYLTKDGGHFWPGAPIVRASADQPSKVLNANQLIFDFFRKHTR